jgi:hypothetical protein
LTVQTAVLKAPRRIVKLCWTLYIKRRLGHKVRSFTLGMYPVSHMFIGTPDLKVLRRLICKLKVPAEEALAWENASGLK